MKSAIYVTDSLRSAGRQIRLALATPLERAPKANFVRAWCSVAYLFPGVHPDGFDDADSNSPPKGGGAQRLANLTTKRCIRAMHNSSVSMTV